VLATIWRNEVLAPSAEFAIMPRRNFVIHDGMTLLLGFGNFGHLCLHRRNAGVLFSLFFLGRLFALEGLGFRLFA
jgi:hypothetical protein